MNKTDQRTRWAKQATLPGKSPRGTVTHHEQLLENPLLEEVLVVFSQTLVCNTTTLTLLGKLHDRQPLNEISQIYQKVEDNL